MIRSNAHTHTTFCDGMNTAGEMAEAALALGFTDLGFSSHAPSPRDPHGVGMRDEAGYRAEIEGLKKRYEGRMGILCGIEKDYYDLADASLYDYVIGDLHYLADGGGRLWSVDMSPEALWEMIRELYGGDPLKAAADFYRVSAENVQETKPDIVGHYDLIAKFNGDGGFFDEEGKAYQNIALEAMDAIIDILRDYGGMVELNLSVFAKGQRDVPYPAPFLLRHLARRGARVIPTSDSHRTATLDAGFARAPALLRQAGFTSMTLLQNGAFIDVKIEE